MTGAPIDTDDMLLIHRVIRRELGQLPALFRAASGDIARARLVGAHATEMLDFLHHHHHGEDTLLYPLLRERVALDAALIARMDAQHAEIEAAVQHVRDDLAGWTDSGDREAGERMAATLDEMAPVLHEHLEEEEVAVLPLVSRTVTQAEWDKLAEHGMAAIAPKRRLVILGHILQETDDAERTRFLVNVPAPARLAYRVIGKRQFERETAALHA